MRSSARILSERYNNVVKWHSTSVVEQQGDETASLASSYNA